MKKHLRSAIDFVQQSFTGIGSAIQASRCEAGYNRYARTMCGIFSAAGLCKELMREEKNAICETARAWGGGACFAYYKMAKALYGFDARFLPENIWFRLLRKLQRLEVSLAMTNKSFYGFLFADIPRPIEPMRCYNGTYYDSDNKCVPRNAAVAVLSGLHRPFMIKPALFSGCGKDVRRIDSCSRNEIEPLLSEYGGDFVCQECVDQSDVMARLNSTSLNCVRITSLFLNGTFSVLSSTVKVGARGAVVDNVGNGGYLVGVGSSGRLSGCGYDLQGHVHTTCYSGEPLANFYVPSMGEIISLVKKCHERLPLLPICGFDIALDRNNNPQMIEINADYPGVFFEQFCTGPILADRYEEVLNFVSLR